MAGLASPLSALLLTFPFLVSLCASDDQLTPAKPLIFPDDKLVSSNGAFSMGFFSPSSSSQTDNSSTRRFYVGIWYSNIVPRREVVWVANRDNPIIIAGPSSSVTLAVTNRPGIVLSDPDQQGRIYWSTAESNITGGGGGGAGGGVSGAALLNDGNLVLRSRDGTLLWQSFDHPTDTVLPGMQLRMNRRTRFLGRLVAWKSPEDPSPGDFTLAGDLDSGIQYMIWRRSSSAVPFWRSGAWTGAVFPSYKLSDDAGPVVIETIVSKGDEISLSYSVPDESLGAHARLSHNGRYELSIWNSSLSAWTTLDAYPRPGCDRYASCGPFSYCDSTEPVPTCKCPEGFDFEPNPNPNGTGGPSSAGCARKKKLRCGDRDRFVTLPAVKTPATPVFVRNRSYDGCAAECLGNCSCTAYAYANLTGTGSISGGDQSRCLLWFGDLVDMGKYVQMAGEDLHLRLAGSPVRKMSNLLKILILVIACVVLLAFTSFIWTCKNRGKRRNNKVQNRMMLEYLRSTDEARDENLELLFISFHAIAAATDNFRDSNMLGKGGFGKVYMGTLEGSKKVAVKRLSKSSGQGTKEFKNEVALIAKLQHKNLVKLLGCCIHEDEKLLVYEYLPNKSLDYFLFDPTRKHMLQWPIRCKIIQGIARGIMYLHQDSRLKIIHRDLKASNILLDMDMSPKISDFGMARIFGSDQHQENTNRVVGTYGYMSPEYAMEGAFSVKSDTYSFGVLLLEIVSGLKINSPHLTMDFPNLIIYAWKLWKDGKAEDLVDSSMKGNCPLDEVSRCIHIGLLCVQDNPDFRPLMSAVVFMLENKDTPLSVPVQPMYFARRVVETGHANQDRLLSVNDMSLTAIEGR